MKKIVVETDQYQITVLLVIVLVLYAITFLAGYFWGKKSALEEFSQQIKNESFSDKVYASLCSLYEESTQPSVAPTVTETESEVEEAEIIQKESGSPQDTARSFVAQLIGYGSEKQAERYVTSLERRGIAAQVVPRTSVTAGGKKKTWYQVVTEPADYDQIKMIAERLAIEDRLAGVSLVEL